jgi:4-diphosphocytidyl-2-C-methyl-D-erythritol kinase
LRQGPLLQALHRGAALPALRNDLQAVVEPEVESVRQGLALLRQAEGPLAVAMSGSGPSLFALFASLPEAEAAHTDLASRLEQAGFEAWCCGFSNRGVSLEA